MHPTFLYRLLDRGGALLYVGIALSLGTRLRSHQPWWSEVAEVRAVLHPSRDEALAAERQAIAGEAPRCNIVDQPDRAWTPMFTAATLAHVPPPLPAGTLLTLGEVGERMGWHSPQTARNYLSRRYLPDQDVEDERGRLWLVETVDEWDAARKAAARGARGMHITT